MPLLKQELAELRQEWNSHRIRYDNKSHCPSGVPEDNYFLPEINNTKDYGFSINSTDYEYIYQTYCSDSNLIEYLSLERKNIYNEIVEKILVYRNESLVNISNAKEIYSTLRIYVHQLE
jgi:hypothetical protein